MTSKKKNNNKKKQKKKKKKTKKKKNKKKKKTSLSKEKNLFFCNKPCLSIGKAVCKEYHGNQEKN